MRRLPACCFRRLHQVVPPPRCRNDWCTALLCAGCGCRELGLWFLDGEAPGYYDAPGARYLTYDNDVRQAVAAAEAQRGPLPALARHMVAAAFQLALFRWAGQGVQAAEGAGRLD